MGVIDFAADSPTVECHPERCQGCHNGHPLWAEYHVWPGMLFEINKWRDSVRPGSHDKALLKGFSQSSDPRLSVVSVRPNIPGGHISIPAELTSQVAIRHGELLANRVIAQSDFYAQAKKLVCGGYKTVPNHWPKHMIDLARMGTGDGGLRTVDPNARFANDGCYHSSNANLEDVVLLLIIHHLYEIDPRIAALYERTNNTASSPTITSYLHFAPGTATAADELLSRVDLVELIGQANLNRRRAMRTRLAKDMVLDEGHLSHMCPKVCQALSGE